MKPKITIITPTFNSSSTLRACLDSVSDQSYPHLEHWIIDGDSKDDTVTIVEAYSKEHQHVRYISEKDKGIYDAMNKGIDKATGEWIFFLGSDDYLQPEILNKVFGQDQRGTHLLYGKIQGETTGNISGRPFDQQLLMTGMPLPHQGSFTHREIFKTVGKFDLKYRLSADRHIFMRIFADKTLHSKFIDEVIAIYGEEGASAQVVDRDFLFDYKDIIKSLYNIDLSAQQNFYMTGMYYYQEIQKGSLFKGLSGVLCYFFKTLDFKAIRDAMYWIKRRKT